MKGVLWPDGSAEFADGTKAVVRLSSLAQVHIRFTPVCNLSGPVKTNPHWSAIPLDPASFCFIQQNPTTRGINSGHCCPTRPVTNFGAALPGDQCPKF